MTKVAVVILNWNGQRFLEQFLGLIVKYSEGLAQIWVADNNSSDNSIEYIKENFPVVKTIILDKNYGFATGYNMALKYIEAEYYMLLNSDVEVMANWIEPLVEVLDNEMIVSAVQPKILSLIDKTKFEYAGASGGFIDILGYPFCRGRLIGNHVEEDKGQYDDRREIFWASGAAIMVRAKVFDELGGFDDNFFAHMEEIDLCWRMQRAGYKVVVEPASQVYHLGGGTLPVWSPQKTYLNFRNNIAMLYKNLAVRKFILIYSVRFCTDLLRLMNYVALFKGSFAMAIFKAHKDFWTMRHRLNKFKELPTNNVKHIYKGSIILYQFFKSNIFGAMMKILILATFLLSGCGCSSAEDKETKTPVSVKTPVVQAEIKNSFPHQTDAYTQGLLWFDGKLYESTGKYGNSSLRVVNLEDGTVERRTSLQQQYFAEGLVQYNDELYQLTWQEEVVFVYDLDLTKLREFTLRGEGWGITTDNESFYISDGSSIISVYDPETMRLKRRISVKDSRSSIEYINELEWIDGKIWANIYTSSYIAVINPQTGVVEKYIDCSLLVDKIGNPKTADVFNGIAVTPEKRIFVTGKNWDTLFEIEIK